MDLCGLLVGNLSDGDGAVRLFSSVALRKLTGQDFEYKAYGTLVERRESIERWTRWLESEGLLARDAGLPEAPPPSPPPSPARSTPDSGGAVPPALAAPPAERDGRRVRRRSPRQEVGRESR